MLAGRGARDEIKAEVTEGLRQQNWPWWWESEASPTLTSPRRSSPMLERGPRRSSCNLVSDLLREQRWVCLSSD